MHVSYNSSVPFCSCFYHIYSLNLQQRQRSIEFVTKSKMHMIIARHENFQKTNIVYMLCKVRNLVCANYKYYYPLTKNTNTSAFIELCLWSITTRMSNNVCHLSSTEWGTIDCKANNLQLDTNLTCGQAFRWRHFNDDGPTMIGVFSHRVWQLKQTSNFIHFRVLACSHWSIKVVPISDQSDTPGSKALKRRKLSSPKKCSYKDTKNTRLCGCHLREKEILIKYLQLEINLHELYQQWSMKDKQFLGVSKKFPCVRVLNQEPLETLFSFLCSVNNSISRIVPMVERMCQKYGDKLLDFNGFEFYDFPSLNKLAQANTDKELRQLGFGYRAPFISQCAKKVLQNGGEEWLSSLENQSYEDAMSQLIQLPGVGMKVADCICLMALNKSCAVPVDTHVRQIAVRDYGYNIKAKSLTSKAYKDIGGFFRSMWGPYAGWAQAILFVADTKPLPSLYTLSKNLDKEIHTQK
ncbi:N-glycosylase/DNA lyase-like [Clavelina lepadiformis]|uniref:N-glycosylase/DNA lyase-like n=1 Tax=Clavelina lepadiformis TaxID=159417 RepID=UPI004042400F